MTDITMFMVPHFDNFQFICMKNMIGSTYDDYIRCLKVDEYIESLKEYGQEMHSWYKKYSRVERERIEAIGKK